MTAFSLSVYVQNNIHIKNRPSDDEKHTPGRTEIYDSAYTREPSYSVLMNADNLFTYMNLFTCKNQF
mgnify:CR=1 FL=1